MKIVTWNINGIRATNKSANSIKPLLDSLNADIICLQETKITRNLLLDDIANVEGYYAFFSFSKVKSGYSGVVTYCKKDVCPVNAEEGITGILNTTDGEQGKIHPCMYDFTVEELQALDVEGRAIITSHQTNEKTVVTVINVYCPMALSENIERYEFKMNFYKVMETKCKQLLKEGHEIILVGDLNVSHKRIDHCDPDDGFEESLSRKWMDKFIIKPSNKCVVNKTIPQTLLPSNSTMDSKISPLEDNIASGKKNLSSALNKDSDLLHSVLNDDKDLLHGALNDDSELLQNMIKCDDDLLPSNRNTDKDLVQGALSSNNNLPNAVNDETILYDITLDSKEGTFFDTYRYFNPTVKNAFTCWNTKIGARQTNYGSRIDYILSSKKLMKYFTGSKICPDIMGSDHCPVEADLNIVIIPSPQIPQLCALNMPELAGKQQTIKSYFNKQDAGQIKRSLSSDDVILNKNKKVRKNPNIKNYFSQNKIDRPNSNTSNKPTSNLNSNTSLQENRNISSVEMLEFPKPSKKTTNKTPWKSIFKGPEEAPLCKGHKEVSVLRTVKKEGANLGRQFYVCKRPKGLSSNKEASCEFFQWKIKSS